jgi:hypothetical protein
LDREDLVEQLSFGPLLGGVWQVSHVVEDIEREMERWTRELGLGPFFYLPLFPVEEVVYRGNPSQANIDVCRHVQRVDVLRAHPPE